MFMRFRGGGVGHKSTRDATNHFLSDRSLAELARTHGPNAADEELTNAHRESQQEEPTDANSESQQDDHDDEGMESDEEQDFGYENPFEDEEEDEEEGEEEEMIDEWEDLDVLGPEDGEVSDGDVEGLGFADL